MDSLGLKSMAMGLHLVGSRGHTLERTPALHVSWAKVEGSNGRPKNFAFFTIKIRHLARWSQVRNGFLGLKAQGNGVTPSRRKRGHNGEHTGTSL